MFIIHFAPHQLNSLNRLDWHAYNTSIVDELLYLWVVEALRKAN